MIEEVVFGSVTDESFCQIDFSLLFDKERAEYLNQRLRYTYIECQKYRIKSKYFSDYALFGKNTNFDNKFNSVDVNIMPYIKFSGEIILFNIRIIMDSIVEEICNNISEIKNKKIDSIGKLILHEKQYKILQLIFETNVIENMRFFEIMNVMFNEIKHSSNREDSQDMVSGSDYIIVSVSPRNGDGWRLYSCSASGSLSKLYQFIKASIINYDRYQSPTPLNSPPPPG